MLLLDVLIQYGTMSLDRTFSYAYRGTDKIEPWYRVVVEFNHREIVGFVTAIKEVNQTPEEFAELNGFPVKDIIRVIDTAPLVTQGLIDLAKKVSEYYLAPLISVLQAMLPVSLSPRRSAIKGPKIAYEQWVRLKDWNEDNLTPKQLEVVRLLKDNGDVLKKEAGTPAVVSKLIENGVLEVYRRERFRTPITEIERTKGPILTADQQKAVDGILASPKQTCLLQGITGSGKTEVYLALTEKMLEQERTVLFLVPEINLTPAMVRYFVSRFGTDVAVLHSGLTNAERYDEYRRIRMGLAKIVVGARSAVFAPLRNIGLIVLDEEHVESYKQDNVPYYHAREVAIFRAEQDGAKVVLGSATPTLETKARAMRGVYGYFELKRRINEKPLPKTEIIDLTKPRIYGPRSRKISQPLLDKISENLLSGKQSILLLNRRGYWTTIICSQCGHYFICPTCGGNLTYHTSDEMLKCHHCGHVELFPKVCPSCGSPKLTRVGYGTERVVRELNELFPTARIARLDSDVGKVAKNIEKTLASFKAGEADILVGTQMVAKGHDFPKVTLSAVIDADIGLSLPTYRASERAFELIAQAVGRSGRSADTGTAMIQTYNPNHYAIRYGALQDYESFFLREMQERKMGKYPPYVYLALLSFQGKSEERTIEASLDFKRLIDLQDFEDVSLLGPITPFYAMGDGKFKRVLLVKFKKRNGICDYILSLTRQFAGKGGIDISINIDPLDY